MDRALLKLLRLRFRAFVRRMFRGMKTVRGAVLFALGLLTMALWLGPSVVMAAASGPQSDPEEVLAVVPLALLGVCLISVLTAGKQKSIYFSPAEVDFLFAGPFSRRELLLYKISAGVLGAALTALFLSAVFARHGTMWVAVLLGCFLSLLLVQLFSTAAALIGQTLAERAYTRLRKLLLVGVLVLLAVCVGPPLSAALEGGFLLAAKAVRESTAGFWLLAIFEPFGQTITAQRVLPELIGWVALAAAVDLAMLGLVMRLDVNYLEAAVAVSQKLYQRRQQAQRRGSAWITQSKSSWRLPSFPWWRGVGPIARRQLTSAIRSARGFLVFFLIMGVVVCVTLFSIGDDASDVAQGSLVAQVLMFTIIFARTLCFDFRGDMDRLESLKSLPLGSVAITVGQLITPVLVMTTIHLLLLGVTALLMIVPPEVLLAIALFALPLNFLLFGLENLFFLLFPARMMASTPGDLQHVGRAMVEMFAKILALALCGGVAAGFGGLSYLVTGGSPVAALAAAWLVLATEAVMAVPCVAWAYRKFDVSTDTPA